MGGPRVPDDRRRLLLRAALGFLQLPPIEPELVMLHRWLDTWNGIGLVAVGMHRQGLRLSLSHIAEGEWRCVFMGDTRGSHPTATAWRQRRGGRCSGRAWEAFKKGERDALVAWIKGGDPA